MATPLPLRPPVEHAPRDRSVVDLDTASSALRALSSETAQSILGALGDGPATTSDLADRVDTSPQNVHYHLENLQAAGLVTEVGTWYSSKGREMPVFALTAERVEVRFTDDDGDEAAAREERPVASVGD